MSLLERTNSGQQWSDDHGHFYCLLNLFIIQTKLTKFVSFEKILKILIKTLIEI